MERLLKVKDIMERYGCSENTARTYMRKMVHTEHPLTVSAAALAAWESARTVSNEPEIGKAIKIINRRSLYLPEKFERKKA
jgi:uncharacterized protein YjcR